MSSEKTAYDVEIMLNQFRVDFKVIYIIKNLAKQFIMPDFGVAVCCINKNDYIQVDSKLIEEYKDWRRIFISDTDDVSEKRYEVLWALMKGGYMKWLRYTFPRQLKNILIGPDNLGNRIIIERLRVWDDKPMYKFLIVDNKEVQKHGLIQEINNDPGFFDYMPE